MIRYSHLSLNKFSYLIQPLFCMTNYRYFFEVSFALILLSWYLITFLGKFFSLVKYIYKIYVYDKKILAIIYIPKEWHHFLEGAVTLVEIWIDHKNLKYFITTKKNELKTSLMISVLGAVWLHAVPSFQKVYL